MKPIVIGMFFIVCFVMIPPVLSTDLQLDLQMPGRVFLTGSPFGLTLDIVNIGNQYPGANVFVALDVGTGDYWFYPGWVKYPPDIDMKTMDIQAFSESSHIIIPGFVWPDGTGSFFDAAFIAAVLSETGALVSNIPIMPFGWTSEPIIDAIEPASGPPGQPLRISGRGFNLSTGDIRAAIDDARLPVISAGIDATGQEYVITVIPPLSPGTRNLWLTVDDTGSNPVALTIETPAPTGKPPGQVITEISAGMTALIDDLRVTLIPEAISGGIIPAEAQADYLDALNRAETLFNGFFAQLEALPDDQRLFFENVLVQNGLDEIFADLGNRPAGAMRSGDLTSAYSCLGLDATSACLTAIDKAWNVVDLATMMATILSGGAGLPVAGGSFGAHFAIVILDAVLDGFFPIDLKEIKLEGVEGMLPVNLYLSSGYTIQGVFDNQKAPLSASFDMLLTTFLEGFRPFIPQTVDDQFRNWVIGQVTGMGFSLGEGIMGDDIMNWGDPSPVTFNVDFTLYMNLDLNNLLAMTIFTEAGPVINLLNYFGMGVLPRSGITVGDPAILEYEADRDYLLVRGRAAGATVLILDAYSFSISSGWWNILGLETPQQVTLFQSVGVSETSSFVELSAGSFIMGSPEEELCRLAYEGPEHPVTLTHGFYMQRTEVTDAQWSGVFGSQPSESRLPATRMTWFDACIFCNRLSELAGLTPCYYQDSAFSVVFDGTPPVTSGQVYWNQSAGGYRLPTEAEWEYACRAGTGTPYNSGSTNTDCTTDPNLNPLAWYAANSGNEVRSTGMKQPNNWGLYDMHGNALEFCWDYYQTDYYQPDPVIDPTGPSAGDWRVLRGGGCTNNAGWCRSATRNGSAPGYRDHNMGFRVVRTIFE